MPGLPQAHLKVQDKRLSSLLVRCFALLGLEVVCGASPRGPTNTVLGRRTAHSERQATSCSIAPRGCRFRSFPRCCARRGQWSKSQRRRAQWHGRCWSAPRAPLGPTSFGTQNGMELWTTMTPPLIFYAEWVQLAPKLISFTAYSNHYRFSRRRGLESRT